MLVNSQARKPGWAAISIAVLVLLQAAAPVFHVSTEHHACAAGHEHSTSPVYSGSAGASSGCQHCAAMFHTWRPAPLESAFDRPFTQHGTFRTECPVSSLVLPQIVLRGRGRGPPSIA